MATKQRAGWVNSPVKINRSTDGFGAYIPPHDIEAEQATIGSMLIATEAIATVRDILTAEDFYRETHRTLFEVICNLSDRNLPADLIHVPEALKSQDKLDLIGGMPYLTSLFDTVPTAVNCEYYADIVLKKSTRRRWIAAGMEIIALGRAEETDLEIICDHAEKAAFAVGNRSKSGVGKTIGEIGYAQYQRSVENSEAKRTMLGSSTGYAAIDKFLRGLRGGDIGVIAARPSIGKTSLAISIAIHIAKVEKKPVLYISLEMSEEKIGQRVYGAMARIDHVRLELGDLTQDEWTRYAEAIDELYSVPLVIDCKSRTISAIRSAVRKFVRKHGSCGLVVIDYLQIIEGTGRSENRNVEVGEFARALQALAQETLVPFIMLSQLNRDAEGKEPNLSNLRESGDIEGVSDWVLFLHRERASKVDPSATVIPTIALMEKNRMGATGRGELGFSLETATYVNMEFTLEPPAEKPRKSKHHQGERNAYPASVTVDGPTDF